MLKYRQQFKRFIADRNKRNMKCFYQVRFLNNFVSHPSRKLTKNANYSVFCGLHPCGKNAKVMQNISGVSVWQFRHIFWYYLVLTDLLTLNIVPDMLLKYLFLYFVNMTIRTIFLSQTRPCIKLICFAFYMALYGACVSR